MSLPAVNTEPVEAGSISLRAMLLELWSFVSLFQTQQPEKRSLPGSEAARRGDPASDYTDYFPWLPM